VFAPGRDHRGRTAPRDLTRPAITSSSAKSAPGALSTPCARRGSRPETGRHRTVLRLQGGGARDWRSIARKAVDRALRPKRVPSMATTSAAGTSQLASTRLSRPAARSAATFHSDRIATPCPATAHSRTTAPSLLHMVGRMRMVSGSREACAKRHSVTSSSFSLTTRHRCRSKSEGDCMGEALAR
jgi:hypothetical protein